MPNNLVAIVAIIVIFGSPAFIILFLTMYSHKQKMEMIRRGINPSTHSTKTKTKTKYQGEDSLPLGLLLAFLGAAGLISTIIHSDTNFLRFGLLALGAGLALLVYWKLTAPERERERRLFEERLKAEIASLPKTTPTPSCPETESPAEETDDRIV
jgi:hypothetical protein